MKKQTNQRSYTIKKTEEKKEKKNDKDNNINGGDDDHNASRNRGKGKKNMLEVFKQKILQ